jgi:hypothetical protein
LQTGLHVQPMSMTNALPLACRRTKTTRKKATKILSLDHEAIMEEVSKCDRLEYKKESKDKSMDKSNRDSEESEESKSKSE